MSDKQPPKMIRFLLDLKEANKLEEEANKLGISTSAFIRLLIKQWSDGIRFEKKEKSDDTIHR